MPKRKQVQSQPAPLDPKATTLLPGDPTTERGRRTWNADLPKGNQLAIFYRKKREGFGKHFHTGRDKSKKPEIFFILDGTMDLYLMDLDGNKSSARLDTSKGPIKFVIEPYMWHEARALTDVHYIEYRITIFNPKDSDTFGWEEFRAAAPDPTRLPGIQPTF